MRRITIRRLAPVLLFPAWITLLVLLTAEGRSLSGWISGWDHWDSYWYAFTWENGYPREDPRNLVYPPGYSYLIGSLTTISGLTFQRTALVVNCLSFWATGILFCTLWAKRFRLPHRSVLMVCFLSSPAAYFCFAAYSDALFNFLLWSLIALALVDVEVLSRRRATLVRFTRPLLVFFLPWLRLTGYALLSWIVLKKWYAWTVLGSLLVWMCMNWTITGDPLYFYHSLDLFSMPSGAFFTGLTSTWHRILDGPDETPDDALQIWMAADLLPMIYLLLLAAVAIWLVRRKEPLLAITVLAILAISHNGAYWRSTVRYDWPLTPLLFLPLLCWAYQAHAKWKRWCAGVATLVLLGAQFTLQVWFARAFLAGRWAF